MSIPRFLPLLLLLAGLARQGAGQPFLHWETAVYATDTWRFRLGTSEPDPAWKDPGFDDAFWSLGPGGIGYGDGDDATVIPPVPSVYLRIRFTVPDTTWFRSAMLHADYDDAFVAYLNGTEMCRANIGIPGVPPAHDDPASGYREATMYAGGLPEAHYWPHRPFRDALRPGENVLAIQVHNQSPGSSDLSALFFLSLAAIDSVGLFGPVPAWFTAPVLGTHLPLLAVTTDGGGIPDEPKADVRLRISDEGPGVPNFLDGPFRAYDGPAGMEIRGNSSFWFPKKGYGLEIRDASGEGVAHPLLGMPAEDDWILHGPYSDKTLLRNALALHVAARIDPWAPRYRFCELVVDGDYRGVYLALERIEIDDARVDLARLRPDDLTGDQRTGGYLLRLDRPASEPDEGWYSPHWPTGHFIEYYDPKPHELDPLQKAYIRHYVTAFEDALAGPAFADKDLGYARWANRRSLAGHFLIQELANNVDAYRLSTFLYKDRDSRDGRLHLGPAWDFNLGFGNVDYCGVCLSTGGWAHAADDSCWAPQPFWWDRLLEDPAFRNTLRCRWDSLRAGPLATDALLGMLDSLQALIGPAAERNFTRWPVQGTYVWPNAFIGADWDEELAWMRAWLVDRLAWLDGAMPGFCERPVVPSGLPGNPSTLSWRVGPNPFVAVLRVESGWDHPVRFRLTDATGRPVLERSVPARGVRDVAVPDGLAAGIYVWSVHDAGGRPLGSGTLSRLP